MLDVIWARLQQKHRTMAYPDGPPPALPERFAGRPSVQTELCETGCSKCMGICPTGALMRVGKGEVAIDLGRCLFCRECVAACPKEAIRFTNDHSMATGSRKDLIVGSGPMRLVQPLEGQARRLFGKSLKLREVSAGGCNACEADTNVLGTVGWDLGRFGVQFVASPRHADGLLITGPVPENMRLGLLKTYEATPAPKLVVVVGACAISGGPYIDHEEVHNGAEGLIPVDLFIPGCPPHPLTILDGILRLLGRI